MQTTSSTGFVDPFELTFDQLDKSDERVLELPHRLLADVRKHATRLERSLGWCLWMAWCLSRVEHDASALAALPNEGLLDGCQRPERVEMPPGTWTRLTQEAKRLDRPRAWLVARAWVLARERFLEAAAGKAAT